MDNRSTLMAVDDTQRRHPVNPGVPAFRFVGTWLSLLLMAGAVEGFTLELPFEEDFEPGWPRLEEWASCETPGTDCPTDDPIIVPGSDSYPYGPLKFETWYEGPPHDPVYAGQRSGRQPIFDPYFVAIRHNFTPPVGGDLRLRVYQYDFADLLCDCDQGAQPSYYTCDCETLETNPPPRPNRPNFDVHGWIVLTNPYRTEYFVLGVNTKQSWTHLSWATSVDGWNVTDYPRIKGWRKMEIIVHPYTGAVGDVEFLVDDQVVALGSRAAGDGQGIDVTWLTLGGDPVILPESHLTNTFEEFWYDEVKLWAPCPNEEMRFDADNDGDVDQTDFAYLQRCFSGEGNLAGEGDPFACHCFDVDGDGDVDAEDLEAFLDCVSGPKIPADDTCDDGVEGP